MLLRWNVFNQLKNMKVGLLDAFDMEVILTDRKPYVIMKLYEDFVWYSFKKSN